MKQITTTLPENNYLTLQDKLIKTQLKILRLGKSSVKYTTVQVCDARKVAQKSSARLKNVLP